MEGIVRNGLPFGRYEFKDVVFNATAAADTEITHSLTSGAPNDVHWVVTEWRFLSAPADPPYVYRSTAANAREWRSGVIVLRCNVASAQARLLLYTEA